MGLDATVGSPTSSTLSRTGVPASGVQTQTDIVVASVANGIGSENPDCSATVTPAGVPAPPVPTNSAIVLVASPGPTTLGFGAFEWGQLVADRLVERDRKGDPRMGEGRGGGDQPAEKDVFRGSGSCTTVAECEGVC